MQQRLDSVLFDPSIYSAQSAVEYYATTPTLQRYIYDICGAAFILNTCGPVLLTMSERFFYDERLHDYFGKLYLEEYWHHLLLEHDVKNLGFNLTHILEQVPYTSRRNVGARLSWYLTTDTPLNILALKYVTERMALETSVEYVDSIELAYGTGAEKNSVTALMATHCNVPNEARHVSESIEFMATLDSRIQDQIVEEVAVVAKMFFTQEPYIGDDAMLKVLENSWR